MKTINLNQDWLELLKIEFKKSYYEKIIKYINYEYENYICYPSFNKIFSSFNKCPFKKLKIIIIGQDPYIGYNQANGLCFSVNNNIKIPPSLINIFKELYNSTGIIHNNGDLTKWAEQGILLLNSILTVRSGITKSHEYIGWELFTDAVINIISNNTKNIVFMLWGKNAQKKIRLISNKNQEHYILKTSHPSPLSVNSGFFGCNHFVKTNNFLKKKGKNIIFW